MTIGANSPAIQDQINQLFSSILLEQQKYEGVRPADPAKKDLLKDKLKEYIDLRGVSIFFSYMSTGRGFGPFTELVDGSVKYDMISSIGVNLLGHAHPVHIKSNLEAATHDILMCGNLLPYEAPFELTKDLVDAVKGSRLKHFWFTCSGSFANDVALKLIWQKKAPKYGIIAFSNGFSGRSIATQDVTENAEYRQGMPKYLDVSWVPHFDQNDPANAAKKTLAALEEVWAQKGEQIGCISMELVQGEGGIVFGERDYYVQVFEWAKSKNLAIWVDEIQTFARTTELFAFQMLKLENYVDAVTVGKVLQACGVFYTDELVPKPGLIAGTFNGSIPAILAGQKTVKFLREGNFFGKDGRIAQLEKKFLGHLNALKNGSCAGKIGYVGGVGTMFSFEVGDGTKESTNNFIKKLFDNGVIAFTSGKKPVRVRFLVPLTLTDEHISEVVGIVEKTIKEVF